MGNLKTGSKLRMFDNVSLEDKYSKQSGRIFISGIQALVRLPMLQSARDAADGLSTACYISGYRGSPLGAFDLQLWQAKEFLDRHNIVFQPGINEDLAATALWGTQQAEIDGFGKFDGVFGIWYGKGPGVDRSGDAFRHANLAGTSRYGGVLAAMGDDHACESSTTAHQSEFALVDAMMPILNPSGVQDILNFGLSGWAMSRYSGCWVGLKCVHDTVESAASVDIESSSLKFEVPNEFRLPPGGLNIRWPDTPLQQEQRLHEHKLPAAQAFWRANSLDRLIFNPRGAHIGIATTGKSYSDVRRAFNELGITAQSAHGLGVRLYKIAMSWPLEREGLYRFAEGLHRIIVVEEKRGLIEDQIKTLLYGRANAPVVVGKFDESGKILLPSTARLEAMQIASVIGQQLLQHVNSESVRHRLDRIFAKISRDPGQSPLHRVPYFCAGCPHNTSTKVPDGSIALAGIGCHYMAQWMDRSTARYTQMGGEGASWIGESKFSKREHVYQNVGDGTYLHSGLLAIRAAVASDTTMTFKLLYNDAVAMTGGQPFDGPLSVAQVARQLLAEGVRTVTVVTDDVHGCRARNSMPVGVEVLDRKYLESVQLELRKQSGVTAIVYEQTCAAEKRRRRRKGEYPDPPKRAFINTAVCEGCGDCGVQSNCVAILPHETEFGRKRRIDQSACNKDYTCVEGFCPSFVTVHGGEFRKPSSGGMADTFKWSDLPAPAVPDLNEEYCIVINGVGGTGVLTVSAILGMAAHLSELGCSVLDMTGLAQKGGSVMSNVIIAKMPEDISSMHVANGGADLILGGDLVVTASELVMSTAQAKKTHAVVNDYEMMSGDFTRISDFQFPAVRLKSMIEDAVSSGNATFLNANRYAESLFGDTITSNIFQLGAAVQLGRIPIPLQAIERAIELNGKLVDLNKIALHRGRQFVADRKKLDEDVSRLKGDVKMFEPSQTRTLDDLIQHRAKILVSYQNEAYAEKYRSQVAVVREAERRKSPGMNGLTESAAKYYFKLLAYKDEYEVARLFTSPDFMRDLETQFEGDYRLQFHMAPPILGRKYSVSGEPVKSTFGPWMMTLLRVLARFKFLRGSVLDPFARSKDRKLERKLISDYETILREIVENLKLENHSLAVQIASYPEQVRGYGHIKRRHVDACSKNVAEQLSKFREDSAAREAA